MRISPIVLLAALVTLVACDSPETSRSRGGRGADVGNRGKVVRMHEGADPFAKTPKKIPSQSAPLGTARQADDLSRR